MLKQHKHKPPSPINAVAMPRELWREKIAEFLGAENSGNFALSCKFFYKAANQQACNKLLEAFGKTDEIKKIIKYKLKYPRRVYAAFQRFLKLNFRTKLVPSNQAAFFFAYDNVNLWFCLDENIQAFVAQQAVRDNELFGYLILSVTLGNHKMADALLVAFAGNLTREHYNKLLRAAIISVQVPMVLKILDHAKRFSIQPTINWLMFNDAIASGNREIFAIIRSLPKIGGETLEANFYSLCFAAESGDPKMLAKIIREVTRNTVLKKNVNALQQALSFGIRSGKIKIFNMLLAFAKKNNVSIHGDLTLLNDAASSRNPEMIDRVLALPAAPGVRLGPDISTLNSAFKSDNLSMPDKILSLADIVPDLSTLNEAAATGHPAKIDKVIALAKKHKLELKPTPRTLECASQSGNLEMMIRILQLAIEMKCPLRNKSVLFNDAKQLDELPTRSMLKLMMMAEVHAQTEIVPDAPPAAAPLLIA